MQNMGAQAWIALALAAEHHTRIRDAFGSQPCEPRPRPAFKSRWSRTVRTQVSQSSANPPARPEQVGAS
jgi:hypothetical protein